ncbi:hypothetical protein CAUPRSCDRAFT_10833 [Caulochytrium protostelioides]|uniref:C3H1-type domain-containing protein n=1 Tax=Caulochytrium protostelioides TaxID=1555241 RepID=A0A4P9WVV5_9FUNG|nr:hypothetical protein CAUPRSCDRAFT_10833 [Caulochytrium protostelioides]
MSATPARWAAFIATVSAISIGLIAYSLMGRDSRSSTSSDASKRGLATQPDTKSRDVRDTLDETDQETHSSDKHDDKSPASDNNSPEASTNVVSIPVIGATVDLAKDDDDKIHVGLSNEGVKFMEPVAVAAYADSPISHAEGGCEPPVYRTDTTSSAEELSHVVEPLTAVSAEADETHTPCITDGANADESVGQQPDHDSAATLSPSRQAENGGDLPGDAAAGRKRPEEGADMLATHLSVDQGSDAGIHPSTNLHACAMAEQGSAEHQARRASVSASDTSPRGSSFNLEAAEFVPSQRSSVTTNTGSEFNMNAPEFVPGQNVEEARPSDAAALDIDTNSVKRDPVDQPETNISTATISGQSDNPRNSSGALEMQAISVPQHEIVHSSLDDVNVDSPVVERQSPSQKISNRAPPGSDPSLCTFFPQCKFGDRCKYQHPPGIINVVPKSGSHGRTRRHGCQNRKAKSSSSLASRPQAVISSPALNAS